MSTAPKNWKSTPSFQVSDDAIWEMTRNWNCYLYSSNGLTVSKDPMNLTKLNTKRDSGLANSKAIGVEITTGQRKIKEKKASKKAMVTRFTLNIKTHRNLTKKRCVAIKGATPASNNTVYSTRPRVTLRTIVKTLQRDLKNYRGDLVPIAFDRLKALQKMKRNNVRINRSKAQNK